MAAKYNPKDTRDKATTPPVPVLPPPPLPVSGYRPSWWTTPGDSGGLPNEVKVSPADMLNQEIMNQLLPILDPFSQKEVAAWLARDNPQRFGAYADIAPTQGDVTVGSRYGPTLGQQLTPQRIGDLIASLDYDTLAKNLNPALTSLALAPLKEATNKSWKQGANDTNPSEQEVAAGRVDTKSALNWLKEGLRAAQLGLPGATRANQMLAQKRLGTLFQEAEAEPQRAGRYKTFLENFLNPVMNRAPLTGAYGGNRAAIGNIGNRRGLAYKNPTAG